MLTTPAPLRRQAPCTRLLCAIHRAPQGSAVEAMLAQRGALLQRATASRLHTALLSTADWLVHWWEGPEEAVDAAWSALHGTTGPGRPILLHRSRGASVLSEPVQIASLHAERGTDVARRLHAIAREHEEGWTTEPLEVWQALSAPCLLGGPGTSELVGRREVLALASDDNEAVDLVRSVAHHAGARIAYQRYAGSDLRRCDVGAAYADLAVSRTTTIRAQALSRRALAAGSRMLGVGHVERLVLLLGRERTRARAVLAETARMLETLDHPPLIHLVSPCDATREFAAETVAAMNPPGILIFDVSASSAATVAAVLDALTRQHPGSGSIGQQDIPRPTAIPQA